MYNTGNRKVLFQMITDKFINLNNLQLIPAVEVNIPKKELFNEIEESNCISIIDKLSNNITHYKL